MKTFNYTPGQILYIGRPEYGEAYISILTGTSPHHEGTWSRLYPKYVVITGHAFMAPHPHRHYTFEEFVDKLNEDPDFRNVILNK